MTSDALTPGPSGGGITTNNKNGPHADKPLGFMKALSPTVAYYDPGVPSIAGSNTEEPSLIVVFSWMQARDVHIAKYIQRHRELYPSSRILLARYSLATGVLPAWMGYGGDNSGLTPTALDILQAEADRDDAEDGKVSRDGNGRSQQQQQKQKQKQKQPRVLVHVFSNGGVATLVEAAQRLSVRGSHLPLHASVFDSCPGRHEWQRTHHAFAIGLPGWASPLVHVAIGFIWLATVPLGVKATPDVNMEKVNSREGGVLRWTVRRSYCYGTEDKSIATYDIEESAAEAEALGNGGGEGDGGPRVRVRLEKFEGGQHVAQARADPERYWRVVRETWRPEQ